MLIGAIKSGTIAKLFNALSGAKANGMLLLESGGQRAQIIFEKGHFNQANAAGLSGNDALHAVKRWSDGYYALKRESEDQPLLSHGHVFIAVDNKAKQKQLNEWLVAGGFETSVIPYIGELAELVAFLKPEVVVVDYPLKGIENMGKTLIDRLSTSATPPIVVAATAEGQQTSCPLPQSKILLPFSEQRLNEILADHIENMGTPSDLQSVISSELGDEEKAKPKLEQPPEVEPVKRVAEAEELALAQQAARPSNPDHDHDPQRQRAPSAGPASPSAGQTGHAGPSAGHATFPQPAPAASMAPWIFLAIGSAMIWLTYFLLRS